jgi:hypothetical protein
MEAYEHPLGQTCNSAVGAARAESWPPSNPSKANGNPNPTTSATSKPLIFM